MLFAILIVEMGKAGRAKRALVRFVLLVYLLNIYSCFEKKNKGNVESVKQIIKEELAEDKTKSKKWKNQKEKYEIYRFKKIIFRITKLQSRGPSYLYSYLVYSFYKKKIIKLSNFYITL